MNVSIYNTSGEKVLTSDMENNGSRGIDVSSLKSGLYLLIVEDGTVRYCRKFLKD
jgi:hypothetical protein